MKRRILTAGVDTDSYSRSISRDKNPNPVKKNKLSSNLSNKNTLY